MYSCGRFMVHGCLNHSRIHTFICITTTTTTISRRLQRRPYTHATLHFIVDLVRRQCAGHVSALCVLRAMSLLVAAAYQQECRIVSDALRRTFSMQEPECECAQREEEITQVLVVALCLALG
ncbi:Hypothetical protein, putative [Bodo saltans]|uniref:Uncharacterized protein n=1 Tax=Bodo saltans TaxID=75058 RepID=A0A0S4J533_BODSA|nr:Hypothetical protein, putative [Bodo saltans]|eukprot:CUG80397.1 Hypothetical protein, putative [Bodo saltans]